MISIALVSSHMLFWFGLFGLLVRRDNLVIMLICLELSLLGISLLFAVSGLILDSNFGEVIFFTFLTLAGVESALGLAFVIVHYRARTTVSWSKVVALKG